MSSSLKNLTKKLILVFQHILHGPQAVYLLLGEIAAGVLLSLGSFILFREIADTILDQETYHFDSSIASFLSSIRNPFLTKLMINVSLLGHDFVLLASAAIFLLFILRKHLSDGLLFIFTVTIGAAINTLLKIYIQRPRPLSPLVQASSYSFPSGHSMNSFIFYMLIAFFLYRYTRNIRLCLLFTFFSLLLVFLIGVSRIYLGVHYPSDVLAGYLAGSLWIATVLVIDKTIELSSFLKRYQKSI